MEFKVGIHVHEYWNESTLDLASLQKEIPYNNEI